jgi:hypothetical protein
MQIAHRGDQCDVGTLGQVLPELVDGVNDVHKWVLKVKWS